MNLKLPYRPLVSGIGIVPSSTRRWATLGLVAVGFGRHWIVTAAHAIGAMTAGTRLTIHQGPWGRPGMDICDVDSAEVLLDTTLDVAAIPLPVQSSAFRREVAHLGPLGAIRDPVAGTRVVKVGAVTGVTAGEIGSVNGSDVRIVRLQGYPSEYPISESGDSGAAWLTWPDLDIVGIHRARLADGSALATRSSDALGALSLLVG